MPGEEAGENLFSHEKACIYRKWSSYGAAILMVITSLLNVFSNASMRTIIMTLYFVFIGLIIVGVEMERGNICQWFLFMNFGWGKIYTYMFIVVAMLSLPELGVWNIIICILFIVASGFNGYLARKYGPEEMDRIRKIVEDI